MVSIRSAKSYDGGNPLKTRYNQLSCRFAVFFSTSLISMLSYLWVQEKTIVNKAIGKIEFKCVSFKIGLARITDSILIREWNFIKFLNSSREIDEVTVSAADIRSIVFWGILNIWLQQKKKSNFYQSSSFYDVSSAVQLC